MPHVSGTSAALLTLVNICPAVQFNLNIDEVDAAVQVFDHWRKDTSTPAFIEVSIDLRSRVFVTLHRQCSEVE